MKCARVGCEKEVGCEENAPSHLRGRKPRYHSKECHRIANLERAKRNQHEKRFCRDEYDLVNNAIVSDIIETLAEYHSLPQSDIVRRAKRDRTTVIKWLNAMLEYRVIVKSSNREYQLNPKGVERLMELKTLGGKAGDYTTVIVYPEILPDSGKSDEEILFILANESHCNMR